MIRRLKHHHIDKEKWDETITNADNPHVYQLAWYLDIVSPGWGCLLLDNYRFIMPLPLKYKWGVPYLVQPPFCQKTGVFGIGVRSNIARSFYRKIFWQFPYFNLQIGESTGLEKRKFLHGRINYTLDLSPSYEVLIRDYKENTLRNIQKAKQAQLATEPCTTEEITRFCTKHIAVLTPKNSLILAELIKAASAKGIAHIVKVTDTKEELLAAACFLKWNSNLVYLAGASSPQGKKQSAMFLIFDQLIREFSETGWLLDFEGSMIPGVARFFRGFGGKAFYYYHLKKYLFFYR